jgi:hypothetical protein
VAVKGARHGHRRSQPRRLQGEITLERLRGGLPTATVGRMRLWGWRAGLVEDARRGPFCYNSLNIFQETRCEGPTSAAARRVRSNGLRVPCPPCHSPCPLSAGNK